MLFYRSDITRADELHVPLQRVDHRVIVLGKLFRTRHVPPVAHPLLGPPCGHVYLFEAGQRSDAALMKRARVAGFSRQLKSSYSQYTLTLASSLSTSTVKSLRCSINSSRFSGLS